MSDIRETVVELIQRKKRDKTMGSWTLAELASNLTLFYTLAVQESEEGKAPFVSCAVDEKNNTMVLLQRWKGVPPKRVGCMDVIKILDEMDAWSNPLFVYIVSDYLFDLAKRDS